MNGRKMIPGKPVPASEIPDYTIHRDTLVEIFSDPFRQRLQRLNTIVRQSGDSLEGNIFYVDLDEGFAGRSRRTTSPPPAATCGARSGSRSGFWKSGSTPVTARCSPSRRTRGSNITGSTS